MLYLAFVLEFVLPSVLSRSAEKSEKSHSKTYVMSWEQDHSAEIELLLWTFHLIELSHNNLKRLQTNLNPMWELLNNTTHGFESFSLRVDTCVYLSKLIRGVRLLLCQICQKPKVCKHHCPNHICTCGGKLSASFTGTFQYLQSNSSHPHIACMQ